MIQILIRAFRKVYAVVWVNIVGDADFKHSILVSESTFYYVQNQLRLNFLLIAAPSVFQSVFISSNICITLCLDAVQKWCYAIFKQFEDPDVLLNHFNCISHSKNSNHHNFLYPHQYYFAWQHLWTTVS